MAGKVENAYGAALLIAGSTYARSKNNLAPVWPPARICLPSAVLGNKPLWRATLRGDNPRLLTTLERRSREDELRSVGRPVQRYRLQGRTGQLNAVASIPVCSPQDAVAIGDIRHRLAVSGEGHQIRGNAAKEGLKLVRFPVETNQLARMRGAGGKDFLSVFAKKRAVPIDWARSPLKRLFGWRAKKPAPFVESVDLGLGSGRSRAEKGIKFSAG